MKSILNIPQGETQQKPRFLFCLGKRFPLVKKSEAGTEIYEGTSEIQRLVIANRVIKEYR